MLIIISARAPFYNTVIPSHLDPKFGIWAGEVVTVMLGLVGGGDIVKCESLKRSPRKRMSTSRLEQVRTWDTELLMKGLGAGATGSLSGFQGISFCSKNSRSDKSVLILWHMKKERNQK